MPDYGTYTGYITCDLAITGLEATGKNPTRQGFVDGIRKLGDRTTAPACYCQPIDVSSTNFGKVARHELHLVRAGEGRQVRRAEQGQAGDRQARRRPGAHRGVRRGNT